MVIVFQFSENWQNKLQKTSHVAADDNIHIWRCSYIANGHNNQLIIIGTWLLFVNNFEKSH